MDTHGIDTLKSHREARCLTHMKTHHGGPQCTATQCAATQCAAQVSEKLEPHPVSITKYVIYWKQCQSEGRPKLPALPSAWAGLLRVWGGASLLGRGWAAPSSEASLPLLSVLVGRKSQLRCRSRVEQAPKVLFTQAGVVYNPQDFQDIPCTSQATSREMLRTL